MTASRWRTTAIGLAVALALSLVGLGFALTASDEQAEAALSLATAESGATTAAKAAAIHLTSYDYTSLATDFTWVRDDGTRAFQTKYATVIGPIKQYVAALKVHARGTVDNAAATPTDTDHVTVLLFVDQTLTTDSTSERKLVTPRITMKMVRTGGRWLVDDASLRNLSNS